MGAADFPPGEVFLGAEAGFPAAPGVGEASLVAEAVSPAEAGAAVALAAGKHGLERGERIS